jgi:hypothetical protein
MFTYTHTHTHTHTHTQGAELTEMALEDFNSTVPTHCIPELRTRIHLLQERWGWN